LKSSDACNELTLPLDDPLAVTVTPNHTQLAIDPPVQRGICMSPTIEIAHSFESTTIAHHKGFPWRIDAKDLGSIARKPS
jgi:hypothetical protein